MPEIRLGAGNNLEDIQLGGVQIEEVRLGIELVWRNNLAPMLSGFTVAGNAVADGESITIFRATNINITFSATDMDVPPDNVVAFRLFRNNVQVGADIPTTTPSATESGSATILNTVYTAASEAGVQATPDVWRIDAIDAVGSEGSYEFMVNNLDFSAPSISPNGRTIVGSAASQNFPYTVTGAANSIGLATDAGATVNVAAACGGSNSTVVTANTVGGGITRSSTATFRYNRTASTTASPVDVGSAIDSTAAPVRGTAGTCIATATPGCGVSNPTCTGPGMATVNFTQGQRIATTTATTRTCDGRITSVAGFRSLSTTRAFTQQESCTATYTNPAFLPVFTSTCTIASGTVGTPVVLSNTNLVGATVLPATYTLGVSNYVVSGTIPAGFRSSGADTCTAAGTGTPVPFATLSVTGVITAQGCLLTITSSDGSGFTINGFGPFGSPTPTVASCGSGTTTIIASDAGMFDGSVNILSDFPAGSLNCGTGNPASGRSLGDSCV